MEEVYENLSWRAGAAVIITYIVILATYRLFLHPLAKFPGPKLAAVTRYYEAYYDLIRKGQYTFRIEKLHEEYGPIIRISPHELHIKDPDYYDAIYSQSGRWDKYAWSNDAHNAPGATITTVDHALHKARRQPLNIFFAKTRIAESQSRMYAKINRLCERLDEKVDSGHVVDIGAAISAFQRDVSTEYVIGKDFCNLEKDDFAADMTTLFQEGGSMWTISKHIPWYGPLMMSIPKSFIIKHADEGTASFMRYLLENEEITKRLIESAVASESDDSRAPTIVDQIVKSGLPPEEKTFTRLFAEVATVTGAAFETTAGALRLVIYHVFSNPRILQRLREEISGAARSSSGDGNQLDLRELERLPYLTAVLTEALRMSPAVGTRSQRIAPDRDILYRDFVIPQGTPVGMTTLLMHMDAELYPEPKGFRPERWLEPEKGERAHRMYAPFSRGVRNCLGIHFAWATMYISLSTLVQRFDLDFHGLAADHFDFVSDRFTMGTRGNAVLKASVTRRKV